MLYDQEQIFQVHQNIVKNSQRTICLCGISLKSDYAEVLVTLSLSAVQNLHDTVGKLQLSLRLHTFFRTLYLPIIDRKLPNCDVWSVFNASWFYRFWNLKSSIIQSIRESLQCILYIIHAKLRLFDSKNLKSKVLVGRGRFEQFFLKSTLYKEVILVILAFLAHAVIFLGCWFFF